MQDRVFITVLFFPLRRVVVRGCIYRFTEVGGGSSGYVAGGRL